MSVAPVKVLVIASSPTLPAITSNKELKYRYINALGGVCRVVCIADKKLRISGKNITLKRELKFGHRKYFSRTNYRIIADEIAEFKPDYILIDKPFFSFMLSLILRKINIPFFVYFHNIEYLKFKVLGKFWWPVIYLIERFATKKAKGIFFVTDYEREISVKKFKTDPSKCKVVPYGLTYDKTPVFSKQTSIEVKKRHGILPEEKVILFFGELKYMPNIESLEIIVKEILPRLKTILAEPFKVVICGSGITEAHAQQLNDVDPDNLMYIGYVEDIEEYIASADVILNPVQSWEGIRTKVVEALGLNKNVVSTKKGAIGVNPAICGGKLFIADDNDFESFAKLIKEALHKNDVIPDDFFSVFSLNAIGNSILTKMLQ